MAQVMQLTDLNKYDWIVVGSGNGACAFLSHYLARTPDGQDNILVLEEGADFFEVSDITHQRNWTRSYSEENIFKLHQAQTTEQTPILSGRACTMGGGGSINYTMIFESSDWLVEHFGQTHDYWTDLKADLASQFKRSDPEPELTPVAQHIKAALEKSHYQVNPVNAGNIPVYQEGGQKQIHLFPTQFNDFGQRTNSGVSLLKWSLNPRLDWLTQCRVTRLKLEALPHGLQRCVALTLLNLKTGEESEYPLAEQTRVLLCAGAMTPQLLYEHREVLRNDEIGQHVNDHILLPFGIYLLEPSQDTEKQLPHLVPTEKDQYISIFATLEQESPDQLSNHKTVCNFDFFAGSLDTLLFLVSHLYLALWVPNNLKFWMIRKPSVFQFLMRLSRCFVQQINSIYRLIWGIGHPLQREHQELNLISAIVKFNISREGYYRPNQDCSLPAEKPQNLYEVILRCFEPENDRNPDYEIATTALKDQLSLIEDLGTRPAPWLQFVIRVLTRMPYQEKQVEDYVRHYSRNDLLTQQHLSGGCVLGKAADLGARSHLDTGKVLGSDNIFVADLSASPLPRVSPQMTAYLIGYHVAHQLTRS